MGDNFIKIRIGSEADNSGFDQAEAKIAQLKEQAAAPVATSRGEFAAAEAAADAEAAAAAERKNAIESQGQVIAETKLALVQAQTEGNTALAAQLRAELAIREAVLTVMRQETLTQAELVALTENEAVLLQTVAAAHAEAAGGALLQGVNLNRARGEAVTLARELATGAGTSRSLGALLGALGPSLSIAGVAGYLLYGAIAHAADESLKLAQEVDKLTDGVIKNANEWNKLAQSARLPDDIFKVAEKALPDLEALAAKVKELQERQITGWAKVKDAILGSFTTPAGSDVKIGPTQKALDEARKDAERIEQQQLQIAQSAIKNSDDTQKAWEKLTLKPVAEAIAEVQKSLGNATLDQDKVNISTAAGIKQWTEAHNKVRLLQNDLDSLTKTEDQLSAASDKVTEEISKIDFDKLSKPQQLDALKAKLQEIQQALRELGINAASPNEALEQAKNLTSADAAEAIRLAGAWSQVSSAIDKTSGELSKSGTEQKKLHDDTIKDLNTELQIDRARLSGNEEQAKKLERQRDLWKEITDLESKGLSETEATALATEKQNLELGIQAQKQQPQLRQGPTTPAFDIAGRDITNVPFAGPGQLTRPSFSELLHPAPPSADFQSLFQSPFAQGIGGALPGAAGQPGPGAGQPTGDGAGKDLTKAANTLEKGGDQLKEAGKDLDKAGTDITARAKELIDATRRVAAAAVPLAGLRGELDQLKARLEAVERR